MTQEGLKKPQDRGEPEHVSLLDVQLIRHGCKIRGTDAEGFTFYMK